MGKACIYGQLYFVHTEFVLRTIPSGKETVYKRYPNIAPQLQ